MFLIVYNDGTNAFIAPVPDAAAQINVTLENANVVVTNLVQLTGILTLASTTFVRDVNFAVI